MGFDVTVYTAKANSLSTKDRLMSGEAIGAGEVVVTAEGSKLPAVASLEEVVSWRNNRDVQDWLMKRLPGDKEEGSYMIITEELLLKLLTVQSSDYDLMYGRSPVNCCAKSGQFTVVIWG